MHRFIRQLITEWRLLELPFKDEAIIVAVSGGADSVSLLLGLYELRRLRKLDLQIIAAHFNHKLSGREREHDEAFVRNFATDLEMQFVTAKGTGKVTGNLEERARTERYKFLSNVAGKHQSRFVLTAHTVNDQAETFLLNLIRGSGPEGLGGMSPLRSLDENNVVLARPLLRWARREDTESFCLQQAVMPRTDEMNADERFTRVRIRRTVIPQLASINPRIVETLARTAELLRPLNSAKESFLSNGESNTIPLAEVKNLSEDELYICIRDWLRDRRGNLRGITLKHIDAIVRLANSPKSGRVVELPGGGQVVKGGGELAFRHIKLE